MKCPNCGSNSYEILKSKEETSKTKEINKLLLKCEECGNVYKEIITQDKPSDYRIIISEHENSRKEFVSLYPDEMLSTGDIIMVGESEVEITSLENKKEGRVDTSPASDVITIWAFSRDIPARIGISIDFKGVIISKKVDVDREFKFNIGDIVKLEEYIFKIRSIKTRERKMRKGFAKASVVKRIYGKPVDSFVRFNYDLTDDIVDRDKPIK
ncbi:HVO_0476 family zinc finger protein [Methanobacterium alcaliphilum]|uniref:HVO_0476 family zinc finger protein n=1 Tax=Methanobacterium alcaliphilum TaxID=392018 RepID=UPI00200B48F7|nr:HVO_0476 family zinc finger protein [Methanobacterium alcaliphilum]MCK9150896.1 hypothetical protein [Methanobacterium alcaliphilum]